MIHSEVGCVIWTNPFLNLFKVYSSRPIFTSIMNISQPNVAPYLLANLTVCDAKEVGSLLFTYPHCAVPPSLN